MKNNEHRKKGIEIIGWILAALGIIVLLSTLSSYFSWQKNKNQYIKVYSFSDSGKLYYEHEEELIEIKKIYDTYDEETSLIIPDKNMVEMYCSKKNYTECIYINQDDALDISKENPIPGLLISLFVFSFAFAILYKKILGRNNKDQPIYQYYLFYLLIFATGTYFLGNEISKELKYKEIKKDNNLVIGTINSELYNPNNEIDLYKPIAYYYVGDKKYIYVNDLYINGNLEKDIGKTIELYYNKKNPNEVCRKDRKENYFISLIGIALILFSFPFVFLTPIMQSRYIGAIEKYNDKK